MKNGLLIILTLALIVVPTIGFSQDFSDYLILQDIGTYKLFTTVFPEDFKGGQLPKYSQTNTGGILDAAGHFSENNVSYEASYTEPSSKWPFVKVEVTQHSGSDSDKWLLHEVESSFRGRAKVGWLGQGLHESASIREINGNKIFDYGNVDYRWISNYVVVYIHYTDLVGTKPEPLEVVQAYLQKFPSSITLTDTEAKSQAHSIQWIKDEMERRLWLCDKWFMQLQLGKAEQKTVLENTVGSMKVFLDYREKYFGIAAANEKNLLAGYLNTNNGTAIKAKLTEYKNWWNENKNSAISL